MKWRTIWFFNLLFVYLILGRNMGIPIAFGGISSLLVWAVAGRKYGLAFFVLSQLLDYQWWQVQFATFEAFVQPVLVMLNKVESLHAQGANSSVISGYVNQTLKSIPLPTFPRFLSLSLSQVRLIDTAMFAIFVPLGIYLSVRRFRKIRKRLSPLIRKMPG